MSFNGTITATYTWTPDPSLPNDPPPASVIAAEDCVAGYYSPSGSGTKDPGVASSTVDTGGGTVTADVLGSGGTLALNNQGSIYTQSQQTRYRIITNPGATLTFHCTPTASAYLTYYYGTYSIAVQYFVTISIPVITLNGTTKDTDGSNNILIGQGCTASMNALPATLSNFQWTIPGDTFKSYTVSNSTPPINATPSGQVSYLSSGDLTSPSPHWYWKSGYDFAVDQIVSCSATATINGMTLGTVIGQQAVAVWAPYHKFTYLNQGTAYNNLGTLSALTESTIVFNGAVGTPALFCSGGTGVWQFTQLCNLFHWGSLGAPVWIHTVTNGFVLDAEFNYSSGTGSPWPANSIDSSTDGNGQYTSSDSPSVTIAGSNTITIDDLYWTYMLYQPPGTDVSWVPLHKMERQWSAALTYGSTTPPFNQNWFPTPPGSLTVTFGGPSSEFPVWGDYYQDKGP